MPSVTMRELKQNPQEVVRQVLATGQPHHITSHGRDTGAVVQPAVMTPAHPKPFLTGAELNALFALAPLTPEQAQAWKDDIEAVTYDEPPSDPWEQSRGGRS